MQAFTQTYQALLLQLSKDTEYIAFQASFTEAQRAFHDVVSSLPNEEQSIILEYLGILAEMQMREIELALMLK